MPAPQSKCLVDEQLSRLALGDLEGLDLHGIFEHLDHCAACQARIDQMEPSDEILAALRMPCPNDSFCNEDGYHRATEWLANETDPIPPARSASRVLPDQIGKYNVISQIGCGGMSDVYEATHPDLQQRVAIKVIRSSIAPDASGRFRREMVAIGSLDHPNVVQAFDAGVSGEHQFLVMELIDGVDLGWVCREQHHLTLTDACEVIRQAAMGLQHAHDRGLVHRDVKPSNLMLRQDGQILLLDLGLARWEESSSGESLATADGQILGTVDYLAPEQGVSHEVDFRADLYSLGASLYKLVTGSTPYDGIGSETLLGKLKAIAAHAPVPIAEREPELPAEFCRLVQQCLSRDPAMRPPSAGEIAERLLIFCTGQQLSELARKSTLQKPASPRIETPVASTPIAPRRVGRWMPSMVAMVLVITGISSAYYFTNNQHRKDKIAIDRPPESRANPPGTNLIREPSVVLEGHTDCVFSVTWIDEYSVASASWDETIRIWDLQRGEESAQIDAGEMLMCLAISPDKRWIAAGGGITRAFIWRLDDRTLKHEFRHGNPSLDGASVSHVKFSPDSKRLLLVTIDGSLWIHHVESGDLLCSYKPPETASKILDASFTDNGHVVILDSDARLALWDTKTLDSSQECQLSEASRPMTLSFVDRKDGKTRVLLTGKSSVFVTNLQSPWHSIVNSKGDSFVDSHLLAGTSLVATATERDTSIRLWDCDTGDERARIQAKNYCTQKVAISPSGRRLVSGGGWHVESKLVHDGDYRLRIWDLPKSITH